MVAGPAWASACRVACCGVGGIGGVAGTGAVAGTVKWVTVLAELSHSHALVPLRTRSSSLMLCGSATRKWSGLAYQICTGCEPASSAAAGSGAAEPSAAALGRAGSPNAADSVIVPDMAGSGRPRVTAASNWPADRAGSRGAAAALGWAELASSPPAAAMIAAGMAHRARRGRCGRCFMTCFLSVVTRRAAGAAARRAAAQPRPRRPARPARPTG